jgi:hypothetical protein
VTAGTVLVALLATYRLTLLVTHDTITEAPVKATVRWLNRRKHPDVAHDAAPAVQLDVLVRRARDPHVVVKLMDCPWCVSFWLGLAVFGTAWWYADTWPWWLACGALAGSATAGILTDLAHPTGRTIEDDQ